MMEGKASVVDYDVVKDYKAIRNSVGYMPGRNFRCIKI
jgi:ABC-type multidrug transport system ATPase subunit